MGIPARRQSYNRALVLGLHLDLLPLLGPHEAIYPDPISAYFPASQLPPHMLGYGRRHHRLDIVGHSQRNLHVSARTSLLDIRRLLR